MIVCLILLQAVLNILSSNVRIHATTKIEMQIRQGIFAAVLKSSISMFQRFIRERY